MLLLAALWLAVVQALASSVVPTGRHWPVDGPSRAASVGVSAAAVADGEFRPSTPQRLPAVGRTSDRSVPPLRSPTGLAAFASAELAALLASVPRAAHQLSHAVASRGGHLPYFPTAPPLQG